MNAYHFNRFKNSTDFQYLFNTKSLYGHLNAKSTYEYLSKNNKRPFIISRSTFPGSGQYTGHWLGDNNSTWKSMRESIPGIYNFQMFGFNMIGADICGFDLNATEILCEYWSELGIFYPFARNHNKIYMTNQDPFSFSQKHMLKVKYLIQLRYSLLRYLYSCLFKSSLRGGMCFKPMFMQFPNDIKASNFNEKQFMFGNSILIIPKIYQNKTYEEIYMPNENYIILGSGKIFNEFNSSLLHGTIKNISFNLPQLENDSFKEHDFKLNNNTYFNNITVNPNIQSKILLRGGKIILMQDTIKSKILNTEMLQYTYSSLIIVLNHKEFAKGEAFFDDGISLDSIPSKKFIHIKYFFKSSRLYFRLKNNFLGYKFYDVVISEIIFYGVKSTNGLIHSEIAEVNFVNRVKKASQNIHIIKTLVDTTLDKIKFYSFTLKFNRGIDMREIENINLKYPIMQSSEPEIEIKTKYLPLYYFQNNYSSSCIS